MTGSRRSFVIGILAALVAAPVAGSDSGHERTRPAAFEGSSAVWCGDIEPVTANPERYRDSPVYVWGNPDVPKVQRWARKKRGYQDLWSDQRRESREPGDLRRAPHRLAAGRLSGRALVTGNSRCSRPASSHSDGTGPVLRDHSSRTSH